jgi:hypothetical protein
MAKGIRELTALSETEDGIDGGMLFEAVPASANPNNEGILAHKVSLGQIEEYLLNGNRADASVAKAIGRRKNPRKTTPTQSWAARRAGGRLFWPQRYRLVGKQRGIHHYRVIGKKIQRPARC